MALKMAKELKTEVVGIRLTKETRDHLLLEAKSDERSVSFVAGKILTNYVMEKKSKLNAK